VTLIVACGLKREARIIERAVEDAIVVIGGGVSDRLQRDLEALARRQPATILSCGVAGALVPSLSPGGIVIGGDEPTTIALQAALPDALVGEVAGQDMIAATATEKRALAMRSGGIAVDMETHIAARVAARTGCAFGIIRAIADTADDDLPPAALVGMKPDGGMALGAVLGSLARHPGQLRALIRTGQQADRAFRALAEAMAAIRRAGIAAQLGSAG
jgi:hypothetical protein